MPETATVAVLRRYPVKSMLGEDLKRVRVTASGLEGDRVVAVIDRQTGDVATAKHPKLWRGLLAFAAQWNDGSPRITLPDGTSVSVADSADGQLLTELLHRRVCLSTVRPERATVARPAPEDVIEHGVDADVPYEKLEIGQGSPGSTFVDFAPVHVITSATLAHVGAEMIRYRPNLVLDTPGGRAFAENDWTGHEISIGQVLLRVILPTPRCAVPTLAHGALPRRPDAVRTLLEENRIPLPGFGPRPCLGAYAQVVNGGTVSVGDRATLP
ncbi:MAG TPA: MOSC N-terminal beta barrel domain-containing protein [Trebonia sp.]